MRGREGGRGRERFASFFLSSQDEGSMDKEEDVPPYDDVYEDVEMGGGSGDDDDDEPSQVYATVSAQHKTKKRWASSRPI